MAAAQGPAETHHQVVVIGGGNAGISLAARLRRYGAKDIAVVEPSSDHLYQPLFSHIAGGTAEVAEAIRPQASVIPRGVTWIQDAAVDVDGGLNAVRLASGATVRYDQLVVCPGIQKDWDAVPGLADAMASEHGASNYEIELAPKAWTLLRTLRQGTVVFNLPPGPLTCGGAAQKPMYLACDYWAQQGVLSKIRVVLIVPTSTVFPEAVANEELNRKIAKYGIELRVNSEITGVDAVGRTVTVRDNAAGSSDTVAYDVLHAVPPQSAPDWLKSTDLPAPGDVSGFVEVDPETLRSVRYPAVWSLGDAAATLNSKSGAALRQQTQVVAKNLMAALKGKSGSARYNNYSACPFTVSRSTVVFSEFDDQYRAKPSIPWKGIMRERRATFILERRILPRVYWKLILKGRA
ncbi:NAD(P)/FAD-dependent oxidoreductase [Arthrobacter sp. CAN_A1]|uniref:NAD(P)/FAD-dependent oxidoreductase n=1 Tax=Arthrobacter sp. CAN_A1 TaxID=2787717 RepID=UPI0018C9E595